MFGKIELAQFKELTEMTQDVASASSAIETAELTGAKYKPVLYCGKKVVRGTNHVFLCEQTLVTNPEQRHLVILEVNAFLGKYELVLSSIVEVL